MSRFSLKFDINTNLGLDHEIFSVASLHRKYWPEHACLFKLSCSVLRLSIPGLQVSMTLLAAIVSF